METYKVMRQDYGWAIFSRQTFLSGETSFWQQASKPYMTIAGIRKELERRKIVDKTDATILSQHVAMRTLNMLLRKIEHASRVLSEVENNLQYIKALKSLNIWICKLDAFVLTEDYNLVKPYIGTSKAWDIDKYIHGCPSFHDKVKLSIEDYKNGNKPFNNE